MYDPDGNRYNMMHNGGYQMMNGGDGGGGWLLGLILVLLLVALLAAVASLFLHVSGRPAAAPTAPTGAGAQPEARLVLDGRLARGEVTAEEYQTVRSLLDAG